MKRFFAPLWIACAGMVLLAAVGCAVSAPPVAPPTIAAPQSAPQSAPQIEPTQLRPGVRYWREERTGETPMVAHVVAIDLRDAGLVFSVTPGDRSQGMEHRAQLTGGYLEASDAVLAFNASYFLPFAGGSPAGEDFYPHVGDPVNVSGAALSAGAVVSPVETDLDLRINAIVCFAGAQVAIRDGQICPANFTDGVAAGPRLLAAGERRSFAAFDNNYASAAHPRTAIGVSGDGAMVWIVVVDGRQPGYSAGASLQVLTDLFVGLGAVDAINLDGGGSATLAADDGAGAARILNRPIHTGVPGRERPVANHIGLFENPTMP